MRPIDAAVESATLGQQLSPIALAEFDFTSGFVRVWSGVGNFTWNGAIWTGVGVLGRMSRIEETTELRSVSVEFELSGVPSDVLTIANGEGWQGRAAKVWFAALDDSMALVGEPLQVFSGLMDTMRLEEGKTATVSLTAESRLVDLERAPVRRYTAEDQRAEYPGDRGFDSVPMLQDMEVIWGGTAPSPSLNRRIFG